MSEISSIDEVIEMDSSAGSKLVSSNNVQQNDDFNDQHGITDCHDSNPIRSKHLENPNFSHPEVKCNVEENFNALPEENDWIKNDKLELYCVFEWKNNLKICLICNTTLHSTLETSQNLKNHLDSDEHKLSLRKLFKRCINDSVGESPEAKSQYIIKNSTIDFSEYDNKSSFIYEVENSIACVICKDEITTLSRSRDALIDIIVKDHLNRERHFRNLQDNVSWVCTLPSGAGHITFFKTVFYCSLCEETKSCKEHVLVQAAVNHLNCNHPEVWSKSGLNFENREEDTTDADISLELFSCFSAQSSNSSDCESDVEEAWFDADLELSASDFDEEHRKGDNEALLLSLECGKTIRSKETDSLVSEEGMVSDDLDIGEVNMCSQSVENIKIINDNSHQNHGPEKVDCPSIEETFSNGSSSSTLICPDCGENVNILNNEPEFSLDLHSQTHKNIEDDYLQVEISPCDFNENVDYVCPDCDKIVRVFNKDLAISFNRHYQDCHDNFIELMSARERTSLNDTFFSEVFDCLPQAFQENRKFVEINQGSLYCKICNYSFDIEMNVFAASAVLNDHFLLKYHAMQLKVVSKLTRLNSKNSRTKLKPTVSIKAQCKGANRLLTEPVTQSKVSHNIKTRIFTRTKINCTKNQSNSHSRLTNSSPKNENEAISSVSAPKNDVPTTITTKSLSVIFDHFPEHLLIHKEFIALKENKYCCCLCSFEEEVAENKIKGHITDISHRMTILLRIKEHLEEGEQYKVRFLMFINGQLYCNVCKCYITWIDFSSVCKKVKIHFRSANHPAMNNQQMKPSKLTMGSDIETTQIRALKDGMVDPEIHQKGDIGVKKIEEEYWIECNLENPVVVFKEQEVTGCDISPRGKFEPEVKCRSFGSLEEGLSSDLNSAANVNPKVWNLAGENSKENTTSSPNDMTKKQVIVTVAGNENPSDASKLDKESSSEACKDFSLIPINLHSNSSCETKLEHMDLVSLFFHDPRSQSCKLYDLPSTSGNSKTDTRDTKSTNPKKESKKLKSHASLDSLLQAIEVHVPQLRVNEKFLSKSGQDFYCNLCCKGIGFSGIPEKLGSNFNSHFESAAHKYFFKNFHSPVVPIADPRLNEISKIEPLISENLLFIEPHAKDFLCTLCPAIILNSSFNKQLATNFVKHFKGREHLYKLNTKPAKQQL